jgi:hypothetical protein
MPYADYKVLSLFFAFFTTKIKIIGILIFLQFEDVGTRLADVPLLRL